MESHQPNYDTEEYQMIRLHFIKRRDAYRWILSTGKLFNQKGVALVTALIKDTINMTLWGEPPASGKFPDIPCLTNAITTEGSSCTTTITLPAALSGGGYTANITIKR